jgi:hypothetical protein
MNNGGVLENEIEVEGKIYQRYWIDLTKWNRLASTRQALLLLVIFYINFVSF